MARGRDAEDRTILQMALVGYQVEKEKIEARIYELQALLRGKPSSIASGTQRPPVKRVLSEAARARIAAAQKKRWAAHRRLKAQQAKAQ